MGKKDGLEGREGVRDCPDYVADFFDFEKACQKFPDLRAKLEGMPAKDQIFKAFGFFSVEISDVYAQIENPEKVKISVLNGLEYQRMFYEKLIDIFVKKVEPRIWIIKKAAIDTGVPELEFPSGWEDRIRYDVAFAFVVHFGQKRHESDYDPETGESSGELLDYIRHPLRVALSETRPISVGPIDEVTVGLAVLHDVVEDFGRGLFGEKGIGLPKKALDDLKSRMLQNIDENQPPSLSKSGDKMSRLISVVSKDDDPKKSREQHLIDLLKKLTFLPDDCVPDNRLGLFLNNLKCFVVKVLDRLDNEQTSRYLKDKKPVVFEAMMNETSFVFYIASMLFGMASAADWITDFVELIDKEAWRPFFNFKKIERKAYDPEASLIRFFQTKMEQHSGVTGFSPIYGHDYTIISRPRALRHRKEAFDEKARTHDHPVSSFEAEAMSQPFQHNIIFVPLTGNPQMNLMIADVARSIFSEFFLPLDRSEYSEDRNTLFGSLFEYARDRRSSENVDRPSLGEVVYKVFDGPEDMRKKLYGLIHSSIIDRDVFSMAYMDRAFKFIADYVTKLEFNSTCLDYADGLSAIVDVIEGLAFNVVEGVCGYDSSDTSRFIDPKVVSELKKLVEFDVYALFAPVVNAKVKITRIKRGKQRVDDLGEISLPCGSSVAYALFHTLPTLLSCKILGRFDGKYFDGDICSPIREGEDVNILIDEDSFLDEDLQAYQIEVARRSLKLDILPFTARSNGLDLARLDSVLEA
ncbi:MAG: hypothetical protein UT33_C0010G0013 [Candidatus Peregrinibacteria bacterium GW2011_GWC2_39_14]|nr:MAG: hypothetical protein US92_C0006G0013 [Candidatus Peregrinibacteria bacterium GW2011_GWA2_38_36]KKR05870.1 MAG: hypothetical protein UT33_C0010G0013 [Candidatus Peregrinibacteria bacterium GW2011_GWC2_39_14]